MRSDATMRRGFARRLRFRLGGGVAAALLLAAHGAVAQPTARVAQGALAGREAAPGVSAFLGVPFAAPPTGDRRWRAPAPAASWRGVRAADSFGASCPQAVMPNGFGPWTAEYVVQAPVAEDCLFLNVWAPAAPAAKGKKRPVMVWIHGGAFISGSGSVPIYDGARLAAKDVVVVTVNYRLGVLGFLAHPALTAEGGASGNYGLMDQIAALQWIKANIGAFGGDPRQVTIAGQSAGALSVLALMEAPQARGLFSRAIAQSGAGLSMPMPSLAAAEGVGSAVADAKGARTAAALRALSVEQLLAPTPTPSAGGVPGLQFVPIRDGRVLSTAEAAFADVPFMTGLTADEGSGFNPFYGKATAAQFQGQVRAQYAARADDVLKLYPAADDDAARRASLDLARDRGIAATLLWLEGHAAAAPRYAYFYDHPEPGPGAAQFGAFHSSEIPYVFDTLAASPSRPFTDQDRALAQAMSSYWVNFIRAGDPNGAGLQPWAPYRAGAEEIMGLGDTVGPRRLGPGKHQLFRDHSRAGGQVSVF